MEQAVTSPSTSTSTSTGNQSTGGAASPQSQNAQANAQSAEGKGTGAPGVPGQKSTNPISQNQEAQYEELVINGQKRKFTKEQLRNAAILGVGAHEKFESAAQIAKKQAAWKAQVQKDFIQALQDPELGLSKEQIKARFEQWYKGEFIDPETMNEDQKRAARAEREAQELREEKQRREEADAQAKQEQSDNEMRQTVQKEIIGFLETAGLPKTRFFANRASFWKAANLSKGFDAPDSVIKEQVDAEMNSVVEHYVKNATAEDIVSRFGDEVIKKLRQYDLARIKQKLNPQQTQNNPAPNQVEKGKKMGQKTMADVDNYFNELRRSRR